MIGPLIVLASLWCASGHLTVATEGGGTRVAVPPQLSIAGVAAALLFIAVISGWRRSPWSAAPALLATLAWWPIPLPPIGLLFTGPLAFLPIWCAAALALALHPPRWRPQTSWPVPAPARAALAAGAASAAISIAVAWQLSPRLPGGDEPHYLVITQSLLRDGDLKIQNNHDRGDYREYYGGELRPDYIALPNVKDVYSIHAPGVAAVILPGFAIAGYRGAQATMIVLSAIAVALIWLAAFAATRSPAAAWFAWAATVSSLTFLIQSVTVFPDGAGMAAVAAGVWLLCRPDARERAPGIRPLVAVSIALAALPWLHSRFVVLAVGLGVTIAWQLSREPRGAARTRLAAFLAAPVISAAAWFAFFKVIYGTFNPSAPYGAAPVTFLSYVPGGLVALFLDQQFGLLTFAPALGIAGLGLFGREADRRSRRLARVLAAVAIAYLAAAASYWMWWAGVPAPPARFATAALPLLAVPAAIAWARADTMARGLGLTLLAVNVIIGVALLTIDHGALAWDVRGPSASWLAWLGPVVDLSRGWPSFFWRLTPPEVSTEGAFARHAVAWLAVWLLSAGALVRLARRGWSHRRVATAAAWWLPVTLAGAVQLGWWLDAPTTVYRPLISQLAVLRATAHETPGLRLAGFSAQPFLGATTAGLRLKTGVPPQDSESGKWAVSVLTDLPAGVYQLDVVSRRPIRGTLRLRSGARDAPFKTLPVAALSQQSFTLQLPASLPALVIDPDEPLAQVGGHVEVAPVVVPSPSFTANRATASRAGALFFLDDSVFVEADAFWVKGGTTAEFIVVVDDGREAIDLDLANGAAANAVMVATEAGSSTLALTPSESRALTVRVPPTSRAVHVRIASPAGFRPSDSGTSQDRRFLGVRVAVR
ncbi:MAG TPA: hypothetical protein VFV98_15010 [Vicinamibacterales bacterium]|nr:hypothetical protein [Vicinamibacterales bacterium]